MARYSFIAEEKACPQGSGPVAELCRVLERSRSGSFDWERRGPSDRELSDAALAAEIEAIYVTSEQTYGSLRVRTTITDKQAKPADGSSRGTSARPNPTRSGVATSSATRRSRTVRW